MVDEPLTQAVSGWESAAQVNSERFLSGHSRVNMQAACLWQMRTCQDPALLKLANGLVELYLRSECCV
jgi:hypothetical protein